MKRRYMLYSDYGLDPDRVSLLKQRCRQLGADGHIDLLRCALRANGEIAPALYYSLVSGASYDRLSAA